MLSSTGRQVVYAEFDYSVTGVLGQWPRWLKPNLVCQQASLPRPFYTVHMYTLSPIHAPALRHEDEIDPLVLPFPSLHSS